MSVFIREMRPKDWEQVRLIYQQGMDTYIATFETKTTSWEDWDNGHIKAGRIVAEMNDEIVGWAALSQVSKRAVYSGVMEVSLYIKESFQRMGIGKKLLESLIDISEKEKIWTLQSGIFRENVASQNLHKRCGFRKVGIREKIGNRGDGVWRDIVLMERRSPVVGLNNQKDKSM